jgi:DNA repair protein RecO (recombination protein O)
MRFEDEGIILSKRSHGEGSVILTLFTQGHGVHKGLLRSVKKHRSFLESGSHLAVTWNARLADHLGTWSIEPLFTPLAYIMTQSVALQTLNTACHLIETALPERDSHTSCYLSFLNLLKAFETDYWLPAYCHFECELIRVAGLNLDFSQCVVTGDHSDLVYVSPRSGRAVSRFAGEEYKDKLLALPAFLRHSMITSIPTKQDILSALYLTGYFLERFVLGIHGLKMPVVRERLIELVRSSR